MTGAPKPMRHHPEGIVAGEKPGDQQDGLIPRVGHALALEHRVPEQGGDL
jgi:hypothetical protein